MRDFFSAFSDHKNRYFFIFLSIIFITLISINYFTNRSILKDSIHAHQESIAQGVSRRIEEWAESKITGIMAVSEFISDLDYERNQDEIRNILAKGSLISGFSSMYVGYGDNQIISGRVWNKPQNYMVSKRPWYQYTLQKQNITINDPYIDEGLQSLVISICTPVKNSFQGVLCGILALEEIKKDILDINLPGNGYAFLVDNKGTIIFHPDKSQQLMKLENFSLDHFLQIQKSTTNEYILSYSKVKNTDWYIITKSKKSVVYSEVNRQFLINFFIYFLSLIFFIIINFFYNLKQKEINKKLRKSKELLQKFINHSARGILISDQNDNIVFYNEEFLKLTLIDENCIEQLKLSQIELLFYLCDERTRKTLLDIFENTKRYSNIGELTFEIVDCNEISHHFYINLFPLFDENNIYEGSFLFYHEITQQHMKDQQNKVREEILIQQSKMADLGEMIGAISHQWKQPLNALSIMLGNLLQFKELGQLDANIFQENLTRSLENIHYLSNTIDTFRYYYQPQKKAAKFDIYKAIEQTIFILQPHFKNKDIHISIKSLADNHECFNFKNEFQQIMANLLINAKDALLENTTNEDKWIHLYLSIHDDLFEVRIFDNGFGIKEEILKHLFKPFRTSKGKQGTGNGLYISKLIAKEKLEGNLILESSKAPTIFLLTFPKIITERSLC